MFRFQLSFFALFFLRNASGQSDTPVVCGGYVKAVFKADFSRIKINLYTVDGTMKYSSDCSSDNGYFLLPVYDQGEYLVKLISPEGWTTSPSEVPLAWRNSDDPCAGKDILFELLGFRLHGQVHNNGGRPGSAGVEVALTSVSEKESAIRVNTGQGGRFVFEGVVPGTYHISISHPIWQVTQDLVQVIVTDDSISAPSGLRILGYDITGSVVSGGEPVRDVLFFLVQDSQAEEVKVRCGHNVNATIPTSLKSLNPVCISRSDSFGKFRFFPLPPASYYIIPYYQQEQLQFEVHPTHQDVTVLNDSVVLTPNFEVQGFSVSGYVYSKKQGSPVVGAKVSLNGVHVAITNDVGYYTMPNVTSGSYILKAEAPKMEFEDLEVYISPSSPSLPPLSPHKYLVAGQLAQSVPISTTGKVVSREILVTSASDSNTILITSTAPSTGDFSLYLALGEYKIKVVISETDAARGLKILPVEQMVSVTDGPSPSLIEFSQFTAQVTGTVKCIENCPEGLPILLVRKSEVKQSLTAQVELRGKEASFVFTNVLPGEVEVSLDYKDWCWEKSNFNLQVDEKMAPITISQSGYSLQYETSHNTLVTYYLEGGPDSEVNLTGAGSLCLSKPGVYSVSPKSCHEFGNAPFVFKTSSPQKLVLRSIKHEVTVPIHCAENDTELVLAVRAQGGTSSISPVDITEVNGTFVFTFSTMAQSGVKLSLEPKSSLLMFSPASQKWLVGNECPELVTPFQGSLGEIVEGKVLPALAGVTIILNFGEKEVVRVTTDNTGTYRAGPFHGGIPVELSAEMTGYTFDLQSDSRTFSAIKLSRVDINVSNVDGEALPRVLISVNGESFRQNSFTDNTGILTYRDMSPGQYFIKPFLREYDFTPSSKSLIVTQGVSEVLNFVGKRVAFSCSGRVFTLNHRPVAGATIQATGQGSQEGCSSYSEVSVCSDEGVYSLMGLLPGCIYTVSIKQERGSASNVLPPSRSLTVVSEDVAGLDFLVVQRSREIYISGWVKAEPKYISTLKAAVAVHGSKESPLHIVAVDPVGFFEFPSVPHLGKDKYVVSLDTNLASNSYKYSTKDEVVSGEEDSYIILPFSAEEVLMVNEPQSKGSVIALVVVIVAAFALVNFETVIANVRAYFKRNISGTSENKKLKKK